MAKIRPSGIRRDNWRQDTPQMQLVAITSGLIGRVMVTIDRINEQPEQVDLDYVKKALVEIDRFSADILDLSAWMKETWDDPSWQGKKL